MKTAWLYELRIDNDCGNMDKHHIYEAVKEIREELERKGCKFSITAVGVIGSVLDNLESQTKWYSEKFLEEKEAYYKEHPEMRGN